ncbi:MAG: ADP-ribosylglycohydrolase family protein [Elusimicrobiales bacterium]|jgi:hypothetical protein
MTKPLIIPAVLAASLQLCAVLTAAPAATLTISRSELADKIRGGWAGKMIGVSYGNPTEFKYNGRINDGEIPAWLPARVENSIHQDDLYVGMTMSETMDRLGLGATAEQFGEAFKASQYHLWHANAGARRLLNLGIKAPLSGSPKYNIHANDIDFQIEADFIGLMCPALPREANKYSARVGGVMNWGDGLYGGMFLNGMYAAAYFENDVRKVVEAGLASIPAQSEYGRLIRDVLDWSAQNPQDWKAAWRLIEDKWDKHTSCPDSALNSFNIDAKINGAYIALGLLYGGKDMGKTVEIAARAGQDSDCNPSSAAGVLGVMLGYKGIPDFWKSGIPALADTKFDYTRSSFNDISKATLERSLKIIRLAGGKVTGEKIVIPMQTPKPPKLEQWNMGVPSSRISYKDPAWSWTGPWKTLTWKDWTEEHSSEFTGYAAAGAGAEAVLTFTGSAVAILGGLTQSGGRADVYLDEKKVRDADAYIVERTHDNVLWHTYGLAQGRHTLRFVTRNDADPRSKGKNIILQEAVIYKAE